jgi:hypothetical protein
MPVTKGVPALMLTLVLAVPGTALAQSAGDEQYIDPFQEPPAQDQGGQGNAGSGGGSQGGDPAGGQDGSSGGGETEAVAPPAPAVEPPADGTVTQDPSVTAGTTSSDGSTLPNTGLPPAGLVVIGALLLGGGITLRRWALPSRSPRAAPHDGRARRDA